jgi:hypothetical protein
MCDIFDRLQEAAVRRQSPALAAALALLVVAGPALAQHSAPSTTTANLQGNDGNAWKASRHMHAFYDLSKATLGHGPVSAAEVDAYEQKAYALFRAFGDANGGQGAAMQDHLKLIPRLVVEIAKADPHALDSYDSFWEAMVGPP